MLKNRQQSSVAWTLSAVALLAFAGCGSAPTVDVSAEVTPAVFNEVGAPVVEIEAPGMHCENCAASIVEALRDKPGVIDVKADAETKLVSVAVVASEFQPDDAIAAIDEAGFGDAALVEEVAPAGADGATPEADAPEAEKAS